MCEVIDGLLTFPPFASSASLSERVGATATSGECRGGLVIHCTMEPVVVEVNSPAVYDPADLGYAREEIYVEGFVAQLYLGGEYFLSLSYLKRISTWYHNSI